MLRYSPMARLELYYLHQIGRINVLPAELLSELTEPLCLRECDQSFSAVIGQAQSLTWTRDPFDRLIVAQAMAAKAKLITHDENIPIRHGLQTLVIFPSHTSGRMNGGVGRLVIGSVVVHAVINPYKVWHINCVIFCL